LNTVPQSLRVHYPFAPHDRLITGQRMHYLDEGQGAPALFVHGNPTWSFLYRDYVTTLRDRNRILVPDHIGCGLSSRPGPDDYPFTLERRIDDLENWIESLALREPVSLAVHDWGGAIGLGYAVRHPDRIRRIAVFNTAAFLWPAGKKFPWVLRLARRSRAVGYLIQYWNAFAYPASRLMCTKRRISAGIRAGYLAPYRTPADRLAILRFVQDIPLGPDHVSYSALMGVQDRLPSLRHVPVAIFWGARDFIFDREICATWSRYFPQARVHMFPDAGHNVVEDEKDAILPLLRAFLSTE
jgi:cis-3-alkyl-4-acyloxetan-2-one decarboxylase